MLNKSSLELISKIMYNYVQLSESEQLSVQSYDLDITTGFISGPREFIELLNRSTTNTEHVNNSMIYLLSPS